MAGLFEEEHGAKRRQDGHGEAMGNSNVPGITKACHTEGIEGGLDFTLSDVGALGWFQ